MHLRSPLRCAWQGSKGSQAAKERAMRQSQRGCLQDCSKLGGLAPHTDPWITQVIHGKGQPLDQAAVLREDRSGTEWPARKMVISPLTAGGKRAPVLGGWGCGTLEPSCVGHSGPQTHLNSLPGKGNQWPRWFDTR